MNKAYEVQKMAYDAARPYAVVATFRSFNRVIARYEDESAANRRARDMNRRADDESKTWTVEYAGHKAGKFFEPLPFDKDRCQNCGGAFMAHTNGGCPDVEG